MIERFYSKKFSPSSETRDTLKHVSRSDIPAHHSAHTVVLLLLRDIYILFASNGNRGY